MGVRVQATNRPWQDRNPTAVELHYGCSKGYAERSQIGGVMRERAAFYLHGGARRPGNHYF